MSQTQTKNTQAQSAQAKNTQNTQTNNAQKYKLILQRLKEYSKVKGTGSAKGKQDEPSTIGRVQLLNEKGETLFKCYSCENGGESSDTPNQDKRIIARAYDLRFSSSGVNGDCARNFPQWQVKNNQCPVKINDGTSGANVVIWLTCKDKPEFAKRRIHLHSGNCPQHTLGCILLGYTDNKDGTISNSAKCVSDFFHTCKQDRCRKYHT